MTLDDDLARVGQLHGSTMRRTLELSLTSLHYETNEATKKMYYNGIKNWLHEESAKGRKYRAIHDYANQQMGKGVMDSIKRIFKDAGD
jgi:arginase family enzyme